MPKAWLGLSHHLVLMTKRTTGLFHFPGGTKETKEVSEKEAPSDQQAKQQLHAFATGEATGLRKRSDLTSGDAKVKVEETERVRLSRDGEDDNSSSSSCWYKRNKGSEEKGYTKRQASNTTTTHLCIWRVIEFLPSETRWPFRRVIVTWKGRWWQGSGMLPATAKVTCHFTCLLKLLVTSGNFLLSPCILRGVESRSRRYNLKTL